MRKLDFIRQQMAAPLSLRKVPEGLRLSQPSTLLATWFGAGLLCPASGTWGTLAAIPFGYAIASANSLPFHLIAIILCFIVGIFVAERYGRGSGEHDAKAIVIDEVAGMWLAALPAGTSITGWAVAFFLFRLFDILKPWPASYFDRRIRSGFGVMMDDIIAGMYAALLGAMVQPWIG